MIRGRALAASFLVACATACGGGASTTDPPAGAIDLSAAGAVVELAGKVTATPPSGPMRDLAKGDTVGERETIATAADASVTIQLAHNGARWSLAGGKQGVVRESVAWSLPKSTEPAVAVAEDMSAGARHSEKAAADTGATAMASVDKDVDAVATKKAALEQQLQASAADRDREKIKVELEKQQKATTSAHATTAKNTTGGGAACRPGDPLCDGNLGGLVGIGQGGGKGQGGGIGSPSGGGGTGAGYGNGANGPSRTSDDAEATDDQKQKMVQAGIPAIRRTCFADAAAAGSDTSPVTITVACTAGKCKITQTTASDAKLKTCLAARIATWHAPGGTWSLQFKIVRPQ